MKPPRESLNRYISNGKVHDRENSFFRELEQRVDEILEFENWIMDLDIENLDHQIRQSTPQLWVVARLCAKYLAAEERAKRRLKKAEAHAMIWAREEHKGKPKHVLEAHVTLDEEVDKAHERYIEVMEVRKALEGLHDALKRRNEKVPGMQGRANFIYQQEARGR